jgi:hypothetical protein
MNQYFDEPIPQLASHSQYDKTLSTDTIVQIVESLRKNPQHRFFNTWERQRMEQLQKELRRRKIKTTSI